MKKTKKCVCGILAACLAASTLLAGCGNGGGTTEEVGDISKYPMQTDVKLTYWLPLDTMTSATAANLGDTPFAKELLKQTGANVEFQHPAAGQESEKLNLMIASNELPDIIMNDWYAYPGGAQKAVGDEVILPLNDLMDDGTIVNLKQYYSENPDIDKMAKTDEGTYYCFPFIRGDETLLVSAGPMVRADWLEELNLSVPETMDDWYNMLVKFRDEKGAQAPLSFLLNNLKTMNPFIGAYGIAREYYVDGNEIKYGPAQPEYKEFLATFQKWYSEKLLDNNIATIDNKILDTNMLTGKTGASVAYAGSGLDKWMSATSEGKAENYRLVGTPYPVLEKGQKAEFGAYSLPYVSSGSAAITTACKYPQVAAKFLDFAYGEEGKLLYNFGVEGESYNMVDGYPTYTDKVLHNEEGLTKTNALMRYIRAAGSGPFVQDKRYLEQYYEREEQTQAIDLWVNTNAESHAVPTISATEEESSELAKLTNAIDTYVSETFLQFIMGIKPLSEFDSYVSELRNKGIDRVLEIKNAQYKRYQTR
ncbi:MAG: extracellular solute-binding protein [Clostridia bacterium]|nr:extracellular solute-binding protein [Clostridia bacterium]